MIDLQDILLYEIILKKHSMHQMLAPCDLIVSQKTYMILVTRLGLYYKFTLMNKERLEWMDIFQQIDATYETGPELFVESRGLQAYLEHKVR